MAFLQICLLVVLALFSTVQSQTECTRIRVERGDRFGTLGTCCVVWDSPRYDYYRNYLISRRWKAGIRGGVGFGGFVKDSKNDRTLSAGIGIGGGTDLGNFDNESQD